MVVEYFTVQFQRTRFIDFSDISLHLTAITQRKSGVFRLVLLLDQIPRNIFRDTGHMFATDPLARWAADRAIAAGYDQAVEKELQAFFYLPFEHSEHAHHQMRSVALFEATGDADNVKWAKLHADIIARFGRFPHRNAALGRESTAAEIVFLKDGGFAG